MRKKDDKVGDKTHDYTKKEGGQREKKGERESVERSKYESKKKKKKKKAASLHPISCLNYINSNFFGTINYGGNLNQLNEREV